MHWPTFQLIETKIKDLSEITEILKMSVFMGHTYYTSWFKIIRKAELLFFRIC